MTNEEAQEMLTRLRDYEFVYREDAMEAHRMACEALEKQIPNIKIIGGERFCPKCDSHDIYKTNKYCPHCGQAIDWSDEV